MITEFCTKVSLRVMAVISVLFLTRASSNSSDRAFEERKILRFRAPFTKEERSVNPSFRLPSLLNKMLYTLKSHFEVKSQMSLNV